jgi:hypothetical protein
MISVYCICRHSRSDNNFGFIGSISHRKAACAVRNRYEEHFVLERGSMAVIIIGKNIVTTVETGVCIF